jgi:cobalt-zinc-cadmium efflux system protein
MEGTPSHINMEAVEKAINDVPGVASCHDLHIWSISSNIIACSFHIITTKESLKDSQSILRELESRLAHNFNITHTTIQIEIDLLRN